MGRADGMLSPWRTVIISPLHRGHVHAHRHHGRRRLPRQPSRPQAPRTQHADRRTRPHARDRVDHAGRRRARAPTSTIRASRRSPATSPIAAMLARAVTARHRHRVPSRRGGQRAGRGGVRRRHARQPRHHARAARALPHARRAAEVRVHELARGVRRAAARSGARRRAADAAGLLRRAEDDRRDTSSTT